MDHAEASDPSVPNEGPGRADPAYVKLLQNVVRPLVGLAHRPSIRGFENLPEGRPFMLVANHSAGMGISEILCFAALYAEQFGGDRPIAGFSHSTVFGFPPVGALMRKVGAVPSTYEAGIDALSRGVPLLVFPGGDHETMRPFWQASRVDFAGRRGFLRMAAQAGVPIVPMGISGSHGSAPMLWRSRVLPYLLGVPRLVGLKRWPVTLLGVLGSAAIARFLPVKKRWRALAVWAFSTSPLVMLPIFPTTIRFRIGEPIEPGELFREDDPGHHRALALVQGRVAELSARAAKDA
jgi:1-acyl-sn-glycerol-3-phosphate acyltransferase